MINLSVQGTSLVILGCGSTVNIKYKTNLIKEINMLNKLCAFREVYLKREDGATAIEYGLIAAGIAVVIIAAVKLVGTNLTGTFDEVATEIGAPGV